MVLLCLGITVVTFILIQLVPGDPATAYLGQRAIDDPAAVKAFVDRYGLDKPVPVQFGIYLQRLVQGDLGESQQSHRPVLTDLREYVPATAELALTAMAIALVVGVLFGVVAAMQRDRPTDHLLRLTSLAGMSVPTFWLALIGLYVFYLELGWAPGSGRLSPGVTPPPQITGFFTIDSVLAGQWSTLLDATGHLLLPAFVLALPLIALLTRFTRSSVLEVVNNEYVALARSKGLRERTVVIHHVLRAALPPIVTVAGLLLAAVLSGTILVEQIFSWPGLGRYVYLSATTLDRPAIIGSSLFIAITYVVVNFVVDILYRVMDPRLEYR